MRALLLAAGFGTRLRPLTDQVPKCLVSINGRPLLDYWLSALFDAGVERVLINTHWLAEQVNAFVDSHPQRASIDLVHEQVLLGTGGTIWANREWFNGSSFIVVHADNLTDVDIKYVLKSFEEAPAGTLAAMVSFRAEDPTACGIIEIDQQGMVIGFHEKVKNPPGNLANGAVYVFSSSIIEIIKSLGQACDLSKDVIPSLLPKVKSVFHEGFFMDIGSPQALEVARQLYQKKYISPVMK
jgi:mannose-1-phosphate guanylyltransferase